MKRMHTPTTLLPARTLRMIARTLAAVTPDAATRIDYRSRVLARRTYRRELFRPSLARVLLQSK